MKKLLSVCLFLGSVILLSGCDNSAKKEAASSFDLDAVKKEIATANQQFSDMFTKGDSVGIAKLYASDAKFMDAGAPAVVGRPAIQSTMSGFIKSGASKVDFQTIGVFGCDSLVAEEGVLQLYVKTNKIAEDKYIVLWKKEDGKWKIFRDISNSNLPPSASK